MTRGFPDKEFEARTTRAQKLMADAGLSALLLTTETEVRYFTGYLTRFWESPTRPWFLIVPASGKPVAVIPSIGADLMGQTWIDDIRIAVENPFSSPTIEDFEAGTDASACKIIRTACPHSGILPEHPC